MPLSIAPNGTVNSIAKITGNDKIRRHLASLGFVEGETVKVISSMSGNIILQIKGSRIAIDCELAKRILI